MQIGQSESKQKTERTNDGDALNTKGLVYTLLSCRTCVASNAIQSIVNELSYLIIYCLIAFGASVAHLSERAPSPLLTWVQFPLGTTYDSYVKRVSQRSAESRGFSPGTPVSSHREC